MDGRRQRRQAVALEAAAPVPGDLEIAPEQSLGGGRAEADDHLRSHDLDLPIQPGAAGGDLEGARLLVQAPLAFLTPLEMFDGVGEVDVAAVDAGLGEGLTQDAARGPYEGLPGQVLLVAGLFADQHQPGAQVALAEDGLGRVLPEAATPAGPCGLPHRLPVEAVRQEFGGRHFHPPSYPSAWC